MVVNKRDPIYCFPDDEGHMFLDVSDDEDGLTRTLPETTTEMTALLQKEIGETIPPMTGYFFIWLCGFFPDALLPNAWCFNLLQEHRLRFKDAARNTKPTLASVQCDLDEYHEAQKIETNL